MPKWTIRISNALAALVAAVCGYEALWKELGVDLYQGFRALEAAAT